MKNLELIRAIPFIDDEIEGFTPYETPFGPTDEKWKEFCTVQKKSFEKRLNECIKEEKRMK